MAVVQKDFVFADNSLETEGVTYLFSLQVRGNPFVIAKLQIDIFSPPPKTKRKEKASVILKVDY